MNIGLYSPYLPKHFGGGEKHMLTTAAYLAQKHRVVLLLPKVDKACQIAIKKYESLFGLDLSKVELQESGLARKTNNAFQNWYQTKKFDAFFYLTDGSFFFAGSKNNILHIQVPYTNALNILQKIKLTTWNTRNANSHFTQKIIEKNWNVRVPFVHYPYADSASIAFDAQQKKEKQILSVGRFIDPAFADLHNKRQDALVASFIRGCQQHNWHKKGWKLLLVGAIEPDSTHQAFVQHLKQLSQGWPITFAHNVNHQTLNTFYKESELYWHAAGLGINEEKQPAKVEHFGMTPVEAMAHGCIPFVTNSGGLKEVIGEKHKELFLFHTEEQLIEQTQSVMNMKSEEKDILKTDARKRSEFFSLERFCQTIDEMLGTA